MGNAFPCIARETRASRSNETARYVCALTRLAYKKAFHEETQMTQYLVGASLLAMDSSAPRLTRSHALSLTIIASKLAPTGLAPAFNPNMTPIPCRSWLASECGVSVAIDIEGAAAFAGTPAPTGGRAQAGR